MLKTPVACMEDTYDMFAEDGVEFKVLILAFSLSAFNSLH